MATLSQIEDQAKKEFDAQDRSWNAPKFIGIGLMTLVIAIGLIYFMSTTTGCRLEIVP